METNKTYFQNLSLQMEAMLKQYKNQYPKNLGALLRNAFPYMLLIFGLVLLPAFQFAHFLGTTNLGASMGGLFAVPIICIFAVVLIHKNKVEKVTDPNLPSKIQALTRQAETFNEYPDVKQYIDGYNAQVSETAKAKRKFQNQFTTINASLFVIAIALITYYMSRTGIGSAITIPVNNIGAKYEPGKTEPSVFAGNFVLSGGTEVIGISNTEPLMTLSPLKTDAGNGCKVATDKAVFFIQGQQLFLKEINITGASEGDVFRLIITDANGQPVANTPKFVFKASETKGINSLDLCQVILSETINEPSSNAFGMIRTCRYLHDNQSQLRFLVDKIK